jgi:hypothetical protein
MKAQPTRPFSPRPRQENPEVLDGGADSDE